MFAVIATATPRYQKWLNNAYWICLEILHPNRKLREPLKLNQRFAVFGKLAASFPMELMTTSN